ncbi:anti-sigma factor family protein [Candidatus Eisenbacteria bacterium]|uniref:Anti-sigma factor family protein n=1 Tax=Eiseniibacteriota bacterium TaxID=2212470 RepID=A0ABV6YKC4_UNCEI
MLCEPVRERIEAFLDGELATTERAEIEAHLVICEGCRSALEERQRLRTLLRDQLSVKAPDGLGDTILAAAQAEVPKTAETQEDLTPGSANTEDTLGELTPGSTDSPWAGLREFAHLLGRQMRWGRLLPALAGAAVIVAALLITRQPDQEAPSVESQAFSRPASVIALRFGETAGGSSQPEMGDLELGDWL